MRHSTALLAAVSLLALLVVACDDGDGDAPGADGGVLDSGAGGADAAVRTFEEPFDATDEGAFLSVWGRMTGDVWAVGGQPEAGVAWRRTGEDWSRLPVEDGPLLNWVHGVGDDVWMVGNGGRALRGNGETFAETPTGHDRPLWGVWAAAADDVWAVGGEARDDGTPDEPVLQRWDGESWTRLDLPPLDRDIRALFKVWGTGPDNVIAVGARGVIIRWDGTEWSQEPSGTAADLISLWGRSPDDILVVGGRSNGELVRWDGASWTAEKTILAGLNGVWMDAAGDAWVAGVGGALARVPAGGFEFDKLRGIPRTVLHATWSRDDVLWVVGGSLNDSPPWTGLVLEGR